MSGEFRHEVRASAAIERLSELIPEIDSNLVTVREFVNACFADEHSDLSRLEAFDAEFDVQQLYDCMALANGYFEQLGIGPDAEALVREVKELRDDVHDYGVELVKLADAVKGDAEAEDILQVSGELHDKAIVLNLDLLAVEAAYGDLLPRFEGASRADGALQGKNADRDAVPANKGDRNGDEPERRLLSAFTGGLSEKRIQQAVAILQNERLDANEKLTRIDAIIPFPPTASSKHLGDLVGVTKQRVAQTEWWNQHRKGEQADEVGRRRNVHADRAKQCQRNQPDDDD